MTSLINLNFILLWSTQKAIPSNHTTIVLAAMKGPIKERKAPLTSFDSKIFITNSSHCHRVTIRFSLFLYQFFFHLGACRGGNM
ncbi:hypothetical protein I3842_01G310400 [Carya illinoinensis]|uniref:Uncharacterized protein n=1 Tax=Carya illinoinensis TaxID=32201 RepID=A0A922GBJ7_CARIL|nr:hypothetical protein I3842_01G310400 [Carya illinoinensis]